MAVDWTKPIQYRSAPEYRLTVIDADWNGSVLIALENKEGFKSTSEKDPSGLVYGPSVQCPFDVINIPETHTVYINFEKRSDGRLRAGNSWSTRAQADEASGTSRVACLKVLVREGQYDD